MWTGEVRVPGDPKQCQRQAARCRELAAHAPNAVSRATFANLAETWDRLAAELENAQRLLDAIDSIEVEKLPEPAATGAQRLARF